MKLLRHWKIVGLLLCLVLVSAYAGGRFGYQKAKRDMRARHNPEQWNEQVMRVLDRDLKLEPAQRAKIEKLIDDAVDELKVVQGDTLEKTTVIINKLVEDVDGELSPEQKEKFTKMKPKQTDVTLDLLKVQPRKK